MSYNLISCYSLSSQGQNDACNVSYKRFRRWIHFHRSGTEAPAVSTPLTTGRRQRERSFELDTVCQRLELDSPPTHHEAAPRGLQGALQGYYLHNTPHHPPLQTCLYIAWARASSLHHPILYCVRLWFPRNHVPTTSGWLDKYIVYHWLCGRLLFFYLSFCFADMMVCFLENSFNCIHTYALYYILYQWFLTLLEELNPASFISAFTEPFVIGKIKYDFFKTYFLCSFIHVNPYCMYSSNHFLFLLDIVSMKGLKD